MITTYKEYILLRDGTVKRIMLRENNYNSSLEKFDRLWNIIVEDFPEVKRSDVEIVQYGGRFYKYTFGIEFNVRGEIPEDYHFIKNPEFTL